MWFTICIRKLGSGARVEFELVPRSEQWLLDRDKGIASLSVCFWTSVVFAGVTSKSKAVSSLTLSNFLALVCDPTCSEQEKVVDDLRVQHGGCAASIATSGEHIEALMLLL